LFPAAAGRLVSAVGSETLQERGRRIFGIFGNFLTALCGVAGVAARIQAALNCLAALARLEASP
jgi:hypothetical protein